MAPAKLLGIDDAPLWLRFNRFVRTGYRPQLRPLAATATFLQWHNESVNVWTHFFPALFLVYLVAFPLIGGLMFRLATLSNVFIFAMSSVYHLYMPCTRSVEGYRRLISCDVFGALIAISTTGYTFILYGDRCADPARTQLYTAVFSAATAVTAWAIAISRMTVGGRGAMFGAFSLLRLALCVTIHQGKAAAGHSDDAALFYHVAAFFALFAGCAVNVLRVPERWLPRTRWLDFVGNSHNIWHLFCLVSCALTLWACELDLLNYENTDCSA
jgi:adiponectin receptor